MNRYIYLMVPSRWFKQFSKVERTIIVQTSCVFAMAVCSKMSGSRTTGVMLAGGMAMFMAPAFVVFGVPRQPQVSTSAQTFQTAQAAQDMRSEPTLGSAVAGAAVAGAAMAGAVARGARQAKGRTVVFGGPLGGPAGPGGPGGPGGA